MRNMILNLSSIMLAFILASCYSSNSVIYTPPRREYFTNSSLDTTIISHLKVDEASFETTIRLLKNKWENEEGGKSIPNFIFLSNFDDIILTCNFNNITLRKCLFYLCNTNHIKYQVIKGNIIFSHKDYQEDHEAKTFLISNKARKHLGLETKSAVKDITSILKDWGIKFPCKSYKAALIHGNTISIFTRYDEINKLEGILLLIDNGYNVSKPFKGTASSNRKFDG